MREVGWKGKSRDSERGNLVVVAGEQGDKGSNYLRSADLLCSGEVVSYKWCLADECSKACATPRCVTIGIPN